MPRWVCFVLALLFMATPAWGVQIVTWSYVVAPNCCGSAHVNVVNAVQVNDPEPFWFNELVSHLSYASVWDCDGSFNQFVEYCCIRDGNTFERVSNWGSAACPVFAKGRSYGWIGGGSFPYHEHQSQSVCDQPCTSCAPIGEDCDYWADPFCDDPWGPY